jgi:hypothetical protein
VQLLGLTPWVEGVEGRMRADPAPPDQFASAGKEPTKVITE